MSLRSDDSELDSVIQAALAGDPDAQHQLGSALKLGIGIPKDEVDAAKWLTKAAEAGRPRAQIDLGVCYYYGQGVPKDHRKSMHWHYAGLLQGRPLGAFNIGEIYEDSDVFPKYLMEALAWYTISARHYAGALERIDAILPQLCEWDVIRAGTRAAEIYGGLLKGTPLQECVGPGKTTHMEPDGPKEDDSPPTRLTLFLTFQVALQRPLSRELLMRELTEGESPLYVNGRLLNEEDHAAGGLPAVTLDCVLTLNGERFINAYSAVQHFAAAHPAPGFRPIALPAKKVWELMDGLHATSVYIDRGRYSDFHYSQTSHT